jgi:uncharacterized circularly permuted ATP-grasp superfamily protein/uncharacterized alpha-E superfamily protein
MSQIPEARRPDPFGFDESTRWEPWMRSAFLDMARVSEWQHSADRLLAAEGAGHLVHDLPVRADGRGLGLQSRPWRLDPIPFVIDAPTFQWLAAAVAERMESLEEVLVDLYGERTLVRDGVVPSDELHASPRYRMAAVGATTPKRWLTTYAVDVVRATDGTWWVVQDLTDAPPGLGYALLDRSVMSRVATEAYGHSPVASLARFGDLLRRALASCSTAASPRTVLFTGGIDHPFYVDHSYLAVELGVTLVEGADLVVRSRKLWLRTLDGLEPVDVVYRRLEGPGIDPLEVGSMGSAGVPGLLLGVRSGGVTLANAHGSGVIEEERLTRHWYRAVEHLTGGANSLPMLGDSPSLRPDLAMTPANTDEGIMQRSVVLRLFACHDGESVSVLPGGSGRVLAPGDDPRAPSACAVKDVWVMGNVLTPLVAAPLPQVDFGRSVPTRAAASLYWMNRYAERAESMARMIRVVSARLEQDPGLGAIGGGDWSERMQAMARRLRRAPGDVSDLPGIDALYDEMARSGDAVAWEIGNLLTEATSVREFLSVTTGRVLERISRCRSSLQRHVAEVDDLDALLGDLAALVGLWNESTVRGPAWRIGDMGRGLERALVVLDVVQAGMPGDEGRGVITEVDLLSIEVQLAANESLVAYRRRYRSDVEFSAACSLLLRDPSNPRSLAACIERVAGHADSAEWAQGVALADTARRALDLELEELIPAVRSALEELAGAVVTRWFAAPVSPVMISGRRP